MRKFYLVSIVCSFSLAMLLANSANAEAGLGERLKGRVLLQAQSKGEAWYMNPDNSQRYYLGRPADAFNLMKGMGTGVSNGDFDAFNSNGVPRRLSGKILLKAQDKGQAYYVNPQDMQMYSLGCPSDAFNVMKGCGLGISDQNLATIPAAGSQKTYNNATTGKTCPLNGSNYFPTGYETPSSPPPANDQPQAPVDNGTADDTASALEQEAFNQINAYRQSAGLKALAWNNIIADVARGHSQDMSTGAVAFGHDGAQSRMDTIFSKIDATSFGENVAYNRGVSDPVKTAVTGWLNSPGHKQNIVGNFDLSAIGVVKSANGSYYFTQLFILSR